MMTYHSNKSKSVIDDIRKLLLNCDLRIAHAEQEIALRDEIMNFTCSSDNKNNKKEFILAKIEKENYQVFLVRLKQIKKELLRKIEIVANKYGGEYSNVFVDYFFNNVSKKEIAEKLGIKEYSVGILIHRMEQDIIKTQKKEV